LKNRTKWICGAGVLAVAVCMVLAWKVTRTPEWTVLTGTADERQVICRSVYKKARWRASWAIGRLLRDPEPGVRVTAMGALVLRPDLHDEFRDAVAELARDADPSVRGTALEYVLRHDDMMSPEWIAAAARELRDREFRERQPQLFSLYIAVELARGNGEVVGWALSLLERSELDDPHQLAPLLRYPALLKPYRTRLGACLGQHRAAVDSLVLGALASIDGRMRGTAREDWASATGEAGPPLERAKALEGFTVEAEWAHRVRPNFAVDVHDGELCLSLGEGAGGDHFWRRHEYDTVDIGKVDFVFTLARSGRYQIWCRSWFTDKCGNHSLLHIDDRWIKWRHTSRDDMGDLFREWHWKRIEESVNLSEGRHTLVLTAGDDGLYYDKLAVLPVGETFDPASPPAPECLYHPDVPTWVSLTAEAQAQSRGTTRKLTVWVRRGSPRIARGQVSLFVPAPFEIVGDGRAQVEFAPGEAVAAAPFRLRVPEGSAGGEVEAKTVFTVDDRVVATGQQILGVNYDWYTTGPLDPRDPRCAALLQKKRPESGDLAEGWRPYPEKGYDRYRRLDFEMAYGHRQGTYIFLYTEIEVARTGDYVSFLTLDDKGHVFVDGRRVAGRDRPGVGEGWMHVDRIRFERGRHQVFAWVYQVDKPDPSGPRAGHHTPNHWMFKWLLRASRHRASPHVRGVPVERPSRPSSITSPGR
jgi:hypothetical protein